MKRVLWCVLPERGHYNPMLGPAAEIESRGNHVTFYAPRDISTQLNAAGFENVVSPPGRGEAAAGNRGAEFAAMLRDPGRLRAWIGTMLVDAARADIEPLRALIRDSRPDVVVLDAMFYAAAIAAQLEKTPWVCVSSSLNPIVPGDLDTELIRTTRLLDPARQALFDTYGMEAEFRVSDVLSPYATVVFTTEAFAGPAPERVVLAGPSSPRRPRGEPAVDLAFTRGRPLIYMSFGTQAYHQPAWFEKAFESVRYGDVALLASVGDLTWPNLPENVKTVPFAPQLEVLREASVFVTHGGANSVMEGVAFGVPLLIAPICNDQHHNAILCERAGVGKTIDFDDAKLDLLPPEGSVEVYASYLSNDGSSAAADTILSFA